MRRVSIFFLLASVSCLLPSAQAATGDILAVRIASATAHNGWIAEIDIDNLSTGGTYAFGMANSGYSIQNDPAGAKIVFTVTSNGYNTSGGTTTINWTVYGTYWMRKAYPNHATADESVAATTLTVRVTLSDYIYSSDTATVNIGSGFYTQGGTPNNAASAVAVTNNSTQAYPKSVCRWTTVPYQQITGDFVIEAACFNRHFQAFKPLAAVKFTCVDEATPTPNSYTATANGMFPSSASSQYGDRQTVLTYAGTIAVSGLTQGDVLTCNFIAYPWVRDSGSLVDTSTGSSDNEALGPLLMLNDKSGTYGGAWAVVDATNGQASTASTWVYSTQAAAESAYGGDNTNSYNTVGRAVQAIKTYNNSNYSRNEPGAGVALCTGNVTIPGTTPASDLSVMETWFTVQNISTWSCTVNALTTASMKVRRLRFKNITFTTTANTLAGTVATDMLWMDSLTMSMTGTAPIAAWKLAYATGNSVSNLTTGFTHFSTNKSPWGLLRGNDYTGSTTINGALYAMLGNRKIKPFHYGRGNTPGQLFSDNGVFAFNGVLNVGSSLDVWDSCAGNPDQVIGWAFVQNVYERHPLDSGALLTVAQTDSCDTKNILLWYITLVGQRQNLGYNSTGSTPYYRWMWSMVGNIFEDWNHKGDTFPTENAARVGGWPVEHNVGSAGNSYASTTFAPSFYGLYANTWPVMVDGTDSNPYVATNKHTSDTGNQPITGGSYASFWTQRGDATSGKSNAWSSSITYGPQAFYNDQTDGSGGGAAGSSYWMAPGASSGLSANGVGLGLLPEAFRPLPYDLGGRPRTNGAAGAYDLAPAGRAQ